METKHGIKNGWYWEVGGASKHPGMWLGIEMTIPTPKNKEFSVGLSLGTYSIFWVLLARVDPTP